jgi:hypothetical protein
MHSRQLHLHDQVTAAVPSSVAHCVCACTRVLCLLLQAVLLGGSMYTAQRYSELFEHQLGNSIKPPLRINLAPPYTLWSETAAVGGGHAALSSRVLPTLQSGALNCVVMGINKCGKPGVLQCKRSVYSPYLITDATTYLCISRDVLA